MSDDGGDGGGYDSSSSYGGYEYADPNTAIYTPTSYSDLTPVTPTDSYAPSDIGTSGSSIDSFVNNPVGGTSYDTGGSSVFDTGSGTDYSGASNLGGPGPVGGGTGSPWDNLPNLNGVSANDFINPTPTGGVSSSGPSGTQVASSDPLAGVTSSGAGPAAATAAGTAAPTGVAGNSDIASLTTPTRTNNNSGGGSSNDNSSSLLKSLGLGGNPLGVAAAGAGLANSLFNGGNSPASVDALRAQAASGNALARELLTKSQPLTEQGGQFVTSGQQQVGTGQALQQYIATGKLPEGYESQVQQAVQAAKTRAISNAASQGLPTDPTQNTALAAALNAIDNQVPALREQLAASLAQAGNSIIGAGNQTASTGNQLSGNQLLQDGLRASGISSDLYAKLAQLDTNKQAAQGQAIANFASALNGGGGGKGVTLKVA